MTNTQDKGALIKQKERCGSPAEEENVCALTKQSGEKRDANISAALVDNRLMCASAGRKTVRDALPSAASNPLNSHGVPC